MCIAQYIVMDGRLEPTQATYSELRLAYDTFNERLFDRSLPPCLITLQREKRTYGYFSSARFGNKAGQTTDEIAINPEYFAVVPVIETLQTMAHEMTHLWQSHHGQPGRGRYHNAEWAAKMESIGLMPSSTGRPGGRRVGDCMADYPIEGGAFSRVVAELINERGFGISWYDRLPPARVLYPVVTETDISGLPAAALEVAAQSGLLVATPQPLGSGAGTSNRSNRIKYSCPKCKLNIWGKPALRVACLECDIELQAAAVGDGTAEAVVDRSAVASAGRRTTSHRRLIARAES